MQITQSTASKECFKCGKEKPLDLFYKHSQMHDGHLNKCKECTKKDVKSNRNDNIDYYRKYDRDRADDEKRVLARKEYGKTEAGKIAYRKCRSKYYLRYPLRRKAHNMVSNYIRDGKLKRPDSCQSCKAECSPEAHHCDYSKPIEVMWLCKNCHVNWHKNNKPSYGDEEPAF